MGSRDNTFQFHKGTIKTPAILQKMWNKKISIP